MHGVSRAEEGYAADQVPPRYSTIKGVHIGGLFRWLWCLVYALCALCEWVESSSKEALGPSFTRYLLFDNTELSDWVVIGAYLRPIRNAIRQGRDSFSKTTTTPVVVADPRLKINVFHICSFSCK